MEIWISTKVPAAIVLVTIMLTLTVVSTLIDKALIACIEINGTMDFYKGLNRDSPRHHSVDTHSGS